MKMPNLVILFVAMLSACGLEPAEEPVSDDKYCDVNDRCKGPKVCRSYSDDLRGPGECVSSSGGLNYVAGFSSALFCGSWDVDGSPPDVMAVFVQNNEAVGFSEVVEGDAVFHEGVVVETEVFAGDSLKVEFYDVDSLGEEYLGGVCYGDCDGLSNTLLKGRSWNVSDECANPGLMSVDLSIYPAPF